MKFRSVLLIAVVCLFGSAFVTVPQARRLITTISTDKTSVSASNTVSSLSARLRDTSKTPNKGSRIPGTSDIKGVELSRGADYPKKAFAINISPSVSGAEAHRIAAALKSTGLYEFVDVMYPLYTTAASQTQTCSAATGSTPNDSCLGSEWYLDTIGARSLWNTNADTSGVTVAVIDSGSTVHPDLVGQWVQGQDLIGASQVNVSNQTFNLDGFTSGGDGDGYDTDPTDMGSGRGATTCHKPTIQVGTDTGWAYANARNSDWHGTAVSGLIAAKRNNSVGISGITPNTKIEMVRVLGKCSESDDPNNFVNGILWAAGEIVPGTTTNTNIPQIINMSLGSDQGYADYCPTVYQDAINVALNKGIVVVASAGNDAVAANRNTPSNCSGVISVGATTPTNTLASYSNTGADLAAPGGANDTSYDNNILVPKNSGAIDRNNSGDYYIYGAGTSYSSPMVASAVAMAMRTYANTTPARTFTPAQYRAALKYSAQLHGNTCTGCGAGILYVPTLIDVLATTAAPSVAQSVSPQAPNPFQINVTWAPPATDSWNPISSYVVEAYSAASGGSLVATCSPDSLQYLGCQMANLNQNTTYYVSVKSTRGSNTSTTSRTSITTLRQATAPTNVNVTASGTSVTINWNPPLDMGDQASVGFDEARIYTAQSGGTLANWCYSSSGTCDVSGLNPSTTYWATVAVTAGQGYSAWSSRVSFTTGVAPATTTTVPSAPAPTTTIAPQSGSTVSTGSSSTSTSQPASAKVGKTVSGSVLFKSAGGTVASGSKVTLKVASSSIKFCSVSGTNVKALKVGSCKVTITVTPKKGNATSKTVTVTVTK